MDAGPELYLEMQLHSFLCHYIGMFTFFQELHSEYLIREEISLSYRYLHEYHKFTNLTSVYLRERLKKKHKTSDRVWTGGGGGPRNILCVWTQFLIFYIWLLSINYISTWLNFNFVFSSKVCFSLLVWSKMHKYLHPK